MKQTPISAWIASLLLLLPLLAHASGQPELHITGNADKAVVANIHALVNLSRYPCHPPKAQYSLIRRQVIKNASQALQAMGYYHSTLSLKTETNTDSDQCRHVTLHVDTGEPVILRRVDIRINGEAASDPAFEKLVDQAQLTLNARLQHDQYTNLKKNLQQNLINRGYVKGTLTRHSLAVDTEKKQATIMLTVNSGLRYHFGTVEMSGSSLNPELIGAYVDFAENQPFNSQQLLKTQQSLLGAGYFSAVRIEKGQLDHDRQRIPIRIRLTDSNRWSLLTGAGFSTDTGPRVRLGIENRRVNRFGHRFRAETALSEVQQGAGVTYQIPLDDPLRERLDLHSSYVNEDTDSNTNERWSTGADYILELNNNWVSTVSLEYLRETWQVADDIDQAELLIPGYQLSRVKANDPVYPTFGWRLSGKLRFARQELSSTASFFQFSSSSKLLFPLAGGRLLMRADLGYTEVTDVTELPASIRFFAGGDASVRGFDYESLGPEDTSGDVIGGRHLATGSLEYDHPISEKWHLAVFTDAGNAFNALNAFEARHSAGFGVRWRSPLGPIRLDLARAVDEHRDWRIHLSMGPDL